MLLTEDQFNDTFDDIAPKSLDSLICATLPEKATGIYQTMPTAEQFGLVDEIYMMHSDIKQTFKDIKQLSSIQYPEYILAWWIFLFLLVIVSCWLIDAGRYSFYVALGIGLLLYWLRELRFVTKLLTVLLLLPKLIFVKAKIRRVGNRKLIRYLSALYDWKQNTLIPYKNHC